MNKAKLFLARTFFKELLPAPVAGNDASGNSGGGSGRELASEFVKRITYKDGSETDFEDPEFSLEDIQNGYNTDSYIRQGVDKYVDQIFKEGYSFYGTDTAAIDYLKLRLAYISEASSTPTSQLLMDIAEDIVKYGNCVIVKARTKDPNALPQGVQLSGLYGKDPIAGYFCANPVTMKCKRDEYGAITEWQQETDGGTQVFKPEDVVHFYYKREKGKAYGTSFLIPVLDDVRALRQAEENVLKMMYRNIYPFYHVAVGTKEQTGTTKEVDALKEAVDGMDVEGGLITTERVEIKPIASNQVIDAEPYLKYMEARVFSGMGIPAIMFGRGNCYDEKTQTLTDKGWKFWYEVQDGDKIGTYNPDTHKIEYHVPNDGYMTYVSHYVGDMIHFKSKHVDIKVSPQHDMWVCTNGRKKGKMKWKKMKAIDLYNSNIQNFYFTEQSDGVYNTLDDDIITIPYIESRYTNGNNNITSFKKSDFIEFLGYFISEGCLNSTLVNADGKQNKFLISLTQQKSKVLDSMLKCIGKLGIHFSTRTDSRDNTVEICIYHKSLWTWLSANVGIYCTDKAIPRELINKSSIENLNILLSALILGDGTIDKRQGRTGRVYYTTSQQLADDVQEICIKLGFKAKILECSGNKKKNQKSKLLYKVLISDSCQKYRYMKKENIHVEHYDGIMYCYNVPNHLFLTRRNGKVAIQGNTANRSTGDNMTSEMADRIRAMCRIIEMFFNSFITKEILMEGGYDPVLNPDQNVEFKFNDNDVDIKIKKEVHAIYKYEHNSITEDEMRDELGMDPIPDSERDKMQVQIITRTNAELAAKQAAEAAGTKETNNKQKNQGGKSSGNQGNKKEAKKKDSIDPKTIGLVKDSIDEVEVSLDKYIKRCYDTKTQIKNEDINKMVIECGKDILYITSKDAFVNNTQIEDYIARTAAKLLNEINQDIADAANQSSLIDIIDVRVKIYEDSLIKYLQNHHKLQVQLIERSS